MNFRENTSQHFSFWWWMVCFVCCQRFVCWSGWTQSGRYVRDVLWQLVKLCCRIWSSTRHTETRVNFYVQPSYMFKICLYEKNYLYILALCVQCVCVCVYCLAVCIWKTVSVCACVYEEGWTCVVYYSFSVMCLEWVFFFKFVYGFVFFYHCVECLCMKRERVCLCVCVCMRTHTQY